MKVFKLIPPRITERAGLIRNILNEFAHSQEIKNFSGTTEQSQLIKYLVTLDKIFNQYKEEIKRYPAVQEGGRRKRFYK